MKRARVCSRLLVIVTAALPAVALAARHPAARVQAPAPETVQIEVVVQDRGGRALSDLTADEFEVQEDGRRVQIERVTCSSSSPSDPNRAPRVFIVVFDRDRLSDAAFARAKRAALALFRNAWSARDVGAVVVDGQATTEALTPDREALVKAVEQLTPAPKSTARFAELLEWPQLSEAEVLRVASGDLATIASATARACTDDPSQCPPGDNSRLAEQAVRGKGARIAVALRASSGRAIAETLTLLTRLEDVNGQKGILILSESVAVDLPAALSQQIVAAADRAHARLYMVNTAGGAGDQLGADTGGASVRSVNDLDGLVPQIERDASAYYVVNYFASRPLDGTFRRVSVGVRRTGAVARARRGYVAVRPSETVRTTSPSAAEPAAPPPGTTSVDEVNPVVAAPVGTILDGLVVAATPASGTILRVRPTVAANVGTLAGGSTMEADAAAGWAAYERGDLETARTRLMQVVARPSAPSWVHYALGTAHFALRHFDDAVSEWERVHAMEPDFEPVYFDLFDAYIQTKQHPKALQLLRVAKKRWPRDPDVFNALATLLAADGAIGDAIKTLEEAMAIAPTDATTLFNMAKAYELQYMRTRRYFRQTGAWIANEGFRRRAIATYEQYLAMNGPYPDLARDALERLKSLAPKDD